MNKVDSLEKCKYYKLIHKTYNSKYVISLYVNKKYINT